MQRLLVYDGKSTKSISPWNVDSDVGWKMLGQNEYKGVDLFFARVPWLYRGSMDRAENVGSMPFAIKRGESDFDTSTDYQNKLLFLPNPGRLWRQMELSLVMTGRAYAFKETNPAGYVKALHYCNPNSISEERNSSTNELIGYRRTIGTSSIVWPVEQFVAISVVDYLTEDYTPQTSPAMAALTASGVLYNADRFIANYFERGAIKATVITVDGGNQAEAERMQNWWSDVVAGIKNAWSAVVLRMKDVKATVIGEGLESLQNMDLTTSRRQDIATALGVPESRMWSSAANYATAVESTRDYFTGTIIPECKTIADAFNEQLFIKAHKMDGYRLVFLTETLDIFQEDVAQQAAAASSFVDFLVKSPTAEIAKETANLIGFELNDAMLAAIDAYFTEKEEAAEEMQAAMMNPAQTEDEPPDQEEPEEEPEPNPAEMRAALSAWKRKALHALDQGKAANVEFITTAIPARVQDALRFELAVCTTAQDVKTAFDAAREEPQDPLLVELRRANDLLSQVQNVPA